MKVLYFHQYFSTPDGAAGTRSYEMARRLTSRGHQVTMVCGSDVRGMTGLRQPFVGGRRRGLVDGIDVVEFDLRYANSDGPVKRAATFVRFAWRGILVAMTERYDLVFATSTPLTAAIPGLAARWLRRKRFVFEVRDLWPELPRAMGLIRNPLVLGTMSLLEWLSYRSAGRLIGLAPGIVAGIVRRGVPAEQVALIPNGCDFGIFASGQPRWRPDGVGAGVLLAVFTGAHGVANGLHVVVEAAAELQRRGQDGVKFALVGEGMVKAALIGQAANANLRNIIFLDSLPKTTLAGLLGGADLGLQVLENIPAFQQGTSPNKFFDYIAAGLPVLINYPGWLADLVVEYRCGWVIPPANPGALADALEEASRVPRNSDPMRRGATALAHEHFDRTQLADAFVDWLEQCP